GLIQAEPEKLKVTSTGTLEASALAQTLRTVAAAVDAVDQKRGSINAVQAALVALQPFSRAILAGEVTGARPGQGGDAGRSIVDAFDSVIPRERAGFPLDYYRLLAPAHRQALDFVQQVIDLYAPTARVDERKGGILQGMLSHLAALSAPDRKLDLAYGEEMAVLYDVCGRRIRNGEIPSFKYEELTSLQLRTPYYR